MLSPSATPADRPMSGEPLPNRPSRLPAHHRLIFAALRQREARHGQVLWSPVDPGGPFLTLIGRLSHLAEALHQALAPLRLDHPGQHHYPAGDLHVTLVNLDHIAGDERAVTAVTAAARNVGPLHLLFAAPSVSRQTVYLPGVDITGQLRRLRRQTRAAAGVRPHPLDRVREDLVFANLVRFQAPLNVLQLRRDLSRMSLPKKPQALVEAAELVTTDKVLSASATHTLAVLSLQRGEASSG